MILRKLADAITEQNWFTVVLEIFIVVVGIFIGLQVDGWNQARKDRTEITVYLERIQGDLDRDVAFFTFLTNEALDKRKALDTLRPIILARGTPEVDPNVIMGLLEASASLGFEFPEVQTVTFFDLRSSGKLALIEDAELRRQLSFYYQESLHRSDRIESRITGFAAAVYEMIDPRAGLVTRDMELRHETSTLDSANFDLQMAIESFFVAARTGRFMALLTAEQNYTEFMIAQLSAQMDQIRALRQAISEATGKPGQ